MKEIIDYIVVYGRDRAHLIDNVNSQIKAGWQPLGGVSVCLYTTSGNYTEYYQAIVKYEKQKPNSI